MRQRKALTVAWPIAANHDDRHLIDRRRQTIKFRVGVGIDHENADTMCFQDVNQIGNGVIA